MLKLGFAWCHLGRKNIEIKCRFHHIMPDFLLSTQVITVDVNLDHLTTVAFARVFHCKVSISPRLPFSYCTLRKTPHVQLTLKEYGVMPYLLEDSVYTKISLNLCRLVYSSHLFIHSSFYISMTCGYLLYFEFNPILFIILFC